ncbi:hypothetical protein JM49_18605 [Pseudomonas chlororaphis subsp. aurantiaca]|nr:hypothetical protein JM49_18605 [Pseudomonas chlororaphis subsp. aurantiaca]
MQLVLLMGQVTRQQTGIALVGFGAATDPLAVVAQAVAIDDIDPVPTLVSQIRQQDVVSAGGLDGHGTVCGQCFQPGHDCASIVGQRSALLRIEAIQAEVFLGDIDADDGGLYCHETLPQTR